MLSHILVVDDESQIKQTFQDIFKEEIEKGYYNFDFANDGKEALQKIRSDSNKSIDLLLTDIKMPEIDGLSLINLLQEDSIDIKTIIISAFVTPQEVKEVIENNNLISGFLSKPLKNIEQLKNIVRNNLNLTEELTITSVFNYDSLQPQDYDFIQQKTGEIKSLIKLSTQTIVEIGCKLIEVKSILKHGQFGDWLRLEFDWSEPTAQRFMKVARKFKSVNLTDLPIVPSALYLLAAPSIPEEARVEALERASHGESINYKRAKAIKDKYTKDKPEVAKEPEQKALHNNEMIEVEEETGRLYNAENNNTSISSKSNQDHIILMVPSNASNSLSVTNDLVEPESWWRLGEEHLLYCGNPDSETFKQSIPQKVDLNLAFPDTPNWRLHLSGKVHSELVFFSQYQDLDLALLRQAIEQLFLLYTEDLSMVVFSFLPDPELILLAHRLKCICRIAEPDLQRCQSAIATSQKAGLNGVRLV